MLHNLLEWVFEGPILHFQLSSLAQVRDSRGNDLLSLYLTCLLPCTQSTLNKRFERKIMFVQIWTSKTYHDLIWGAIIFSTNCQKVFYILHGYDHEGQLCIRIARLLPASISECFASARYASLTLCQVPLYHVFITVLFSGEESSIAKLKHYELLDNAEG